MSEDATVEEKEAKKGNNKKEKNKFQSGFKPQKGQKSEPNKEKGGGRAGIQVFPFPLCRQIFTIFCSAPAWKIEEEAKKSDHVRGKKGKMKKMKEKYKDQV